MNMKVIHRVEHRCQKLLSYCHSYLQGWLTQTSSKIHSNGPRVADPAAD